MSADFSFKTRNSSIDFLRTISVISVILSHTLYALADKGEVLGFWAYGTETVGRLGVSFFIVLSGYLAFQKIDKSGTREFYFSKATGILPVYWITYIFMALLTYTLSVKGYQAFTQFETLVTTDNIDWLGVVFTIFGLDGFIIGAKWNVWIYVVVGEWYIGFIIIMFAFTPLLYKMMKIFDLTSLVLAAFICYISFILFTDYGAKWVALNKHDPYWNPNFRVFEFMFGMYLPKIINGSSDLRRKYTYLAYGVVCGYAAFYVLAGINLMSAMNPVAAPFGCAMALVLIHLYRFVRIEYFSEYLKFFAKYSFIVMLVQHLVIYFFTRNIDFGELTSRIVILLFAANLICSYVIAIIIQPLATWLSLIMRKAISVRNDNITQYLKHSG